jgi:protein TonB
VKILKIFPRPIAPTRRWDHVYDRLLSHIRVAVDKMKKSYVLLILAASVATGAAAEPVAKAQSVKASTTEVRRMLRDPQAEVVGEFDWKAYYPQAAMSAAKNGQATVLCEVNDERRLRNCDVVSEAPADYGFGQAAVRLSTDVTRLAERDARGAPTAGGWVKLQMSFKVPE